MLEKPTRPTQPDIQERQAPRTIQEILDRYDLDNIKIYEYLESLIDSLEVEVTALTTQKAIVNTQATIAENTDYEIPLYYQVGNNSLDVYYMGERLIKGTHYVEVGTAGEVSNTIQFYNWGQAVPANRTIEFVVRGVYASES